MKNREITIMKKKEKTNNLHLKRKFIGLLDKNGKRIHEGDILESIYMNQNGKFKHRCEVKSNDTYVGGGEYDEETIVGGWIIDTETFHPLESFEIIGNIYGSKHL